MSERIARRGQIGLGLLWVIDGALQWQPYMFGRSFVTGVLLPGAAGQPRFIATPIIWTAHLLEPRVALFNAFAATLEVVVGVGLLYRPTVRPALTVSFGWALGIWFAGEGLGMLFTGTASPLTGAPGAAPLYIAAGLACWPHERPASSALHGRDLGRIGERRGRLTLSAIWLGCAVLWLLPANVSAGSVHDAIAGAPSGAGWLSSVLRAGAAATAGRGTTIAVGLAILSGAIGVAVLCGWHQRTFLALQISLLALYWVLGQGLGGVFTGHATDVGTGPPMILAALMLTHRTAPAVTRVRLRARWGNHTHHAARLSSS